MARIERETHVENITVGVTDSPWNYEPLGSSTVVPMDPLNYQWDSKVGESATVLTSARIFDCSQDIQVHISPTFHSWAPSSISNDEFKASCLVVYIGLR